MRKILLHTCCAPCATYVNRWLVENKFEVKFFFYNPNIQPKTEHKKRLMTVEHYARTLGDEIIYEPSDILTTPGDCENCYRSRLRKTANFAKKSDFDCFTTTLLISPYQKHDLLKQVGEEIALEIGIEFYYQDFRVGYRESREMANEMKLYMQKYCGCGIELETRGKKTYARIN